ncbi:hypothetical protein EV175_003458, partial [Coemansia sp. RSA 1933]
SCSDHQVAAGAEELSAHCHHPRRDVYAASGQVGVCRLLLACVQGRASAERVCPTPNSQQL